MRVFPVPVQIENEERVVGGVFTLRQLLYVALGVALGGATLTASFLPLIIRLLILVITVSAGIILSFKKIHDLRTDLYLYYYWKWRKSKKSMYLKGEN